MIKTPLFKKAFTLLFVVGFLNYIAIKFYLYWTVWWFDMIVHFLAGVTIGLAVVSVLFYKRNFSAENLLRALSMSVLAAIIIGLLWEIYELVFSITFLSDGAVYVRDTLSDIIMDMTGGFFGALYGFKLFKKRK